MGLLWPGVGQCGQDAATPLNPSNAVCLGICGAAGASGLTPMLSDIWFMNTC